MYIGAVMSEKSKTVQIFGETYPEGRKENEIRLKDYLPGFFERQKKKFTAEDYYAEMVRLYPEYKKKWYERLPSEKDIEGYFIGYASRNGLKIDGIQSVSYAERDLGVKIGGGYKYPNGVTSLEYHAMFFGDFGFPHLWNHEAKNKKEAYMEAWQSLHYNKDKYLETLQKHYKHLVELNPELKTIRLDKKDKNQLLEFNYGVRYGFPAADIQLFLDGKQAIAEKDRMKQDLRSEGIDDYQFQWVVSSETIRSIGRQLREKNGITQKNEEIESSREFADKSPKEKVLDKLKSWGIEDGSYLLIDRNDEIYTSIGKEKVKSADEYLQEGAKDVEKSKRDIVYGSNNGLVGAYFAEGVYVVSANPKLKTVLCRHAEDSGLGVMLSKGEDFRDSSGKFNETLNSMWSRIKSKCREINIKDMRMGHNPMLEQQRQSSQGKEKSCQGTDNVAVMRRISGQQGGR